jgi:thymidylate kinase
VINPHQPEEYLQLDACSHYVESHCFFFRDTELLAERRQHGNFYVAAPPMEFGYLLAKALCKGKAIAPKLARLKALWEREPEKTQERFQRLCGPGQGNLGEWFVRPAGDWERLREPLLKRHRFGLPDFSREALRRCKRIVRPEGLHLSVLGPDGAGKSTLIERLGPLLQRPFFRRCSVFHFRPRIFEKATDSSPVTNPHATQPRGRLAGIAKLFYYFADHLAGYFLKVLPAKVRNELVIFGRDFNDLLVDPLRYRLRQGCLATFLAKLLPRADLTLILDAAPEEIISRKAELTVAELERQRDAFKNLVITTPHVVVISAGAAPEQVARTACAAVIHFLAERQKQRRRL